jgi:uncharacterized glyoxalase superfamily protein PhnB
MTIINRLCPRLVVDDADRAIRFYTQALGAKELQRYADERGKIVHSELALGDHVLMVKDADGVDPSPRRLGGTPVILSLEVAGVDALAERMLELGAEVIFPVADREYGKRDGRLRDPYGHLWIVSEPLP